MQTICMLQTGWCCSSHDRVRSLFHNPVVWMTQMSDMLSYTKLHSLKNSGPDGTCKLNIEYPLGITHIHLRLVNLSESNQNVS